MSEIMAKVRRTCGCTAIDGKPCGEPCGPGDRCIFCRWWCEGEAARNGSYPEEVNHDHDDD